MSRHTPGPWRAGFAPHEYPQGDEWEMAIVEHDRFDAIGVYAPPSRLLAEHEANARLIAAAPELLENLRDLVAFYDAHGGPMAKSRELLARIDGVDGGRIKPSGAVEPSDV